MLGSQQGSEDALFGMVKVLFPEYEQQSNEFKKRGEEVLEMVGEDPIPLIPLSTTESMASERFRKVRIKSKALQPKADLPKA